MNKYYITKFIDSLYESPILEATVQSELEIIHLSIFMLNN